MPRGPLLAVGFHRAGTGLTRVMAAILDGLAPSRELHWLGVGYDGPVASGAYTLHPGNPGGGDPYGSYNARALIEARHPDAVLLYNDLWLLKNYMVPLASLPERPPVVAYVPLDGELPDDTLIEPLTEIDHFVVFTTFARGQIERSLSRLGRATPVSVIGHAVDTATFRPGPGRQGRAREPGSFVVLNANRPQPRKRLDLTVEGFARFARDKPDGVRLVLHHAFGESRSDLEAEAERLGIADRVTFTPGRPASDAELDDLYNACDVGLNTAMGEGWGLVSFEHAATGAAQIVPGHGATAELWDGAAELLDAGPPTVPDFSPLALRSCTAEGVAHALERLYEDRDLLAARSEAAYRRATEPHLTWDAVAAQWRTLLADLRRGSRLRGDPVRATMRTRPSSPTGRGDAMTDVPLTAMSSTETNGSYQVVIGADDLAPPSRPENNYWFVVVDLSDLSVVANELSASNDSVPAPVLKFAGNPDYMLVVVTVALYSGSIPQGSLTEFLQQAGAGTQLLRLEQAVSQLGTGVLGPVSYILATTLDTSDGFEEMSLDGQSVLTLELVPVDVDGQTRYTPVSLSD